MHKLKSKFRMENLVFLYVLFAWLWNTKYESSFKEKSKKREKLGKYILSSRKIPMRFSDLFILKNETIFIQLIL